MQLLSHELYFFEGGGGVPLPLDPLPYKKCCASFTHKCELVPSSPFGGGGGAPPPRPPPLLENVSFAKHLSSFSSTIWYHFMSCVHIFAGNVCPWKYKMLFHGNTKCISMKSEISIGQK